ncbi:hypothetical protein WH47_01037 [Habropoda laboriosa]|uniref:Uncharacterized protein n=1 Tax=Habropoda laboriosa TaxID=597456 RepID=A0A0L7QJ85_9HYME|nr:hypothetical protein WH47_01037 [Habropoda laboriosa]
MLAKLCEVPEKWDRQLGQVEFALNNTVCRTTGETPSKLLFGIAQTGEINDNIRFLLEERSVSERELETIRKKAVDNIVKQQKGNERYYNNRRKEALVYKESDYVMIRNIDTSAGVNKKLLPKFKGPYQVKKALDCDRYVIEDIDGFQITQIPYKGVIAIDNMRPNIA